MIYSVYSRVLPKLSGWFAHLAAAHIIFPCSFVLMPGFLVAACLAGMIWFDEVVMGPAITSMIFAWLTWFSLGVFHFF